MENSMSNSYTSGKSYKLYDLYAESEKIHKTNWGHDNIQGEDLEYMKKLEEEGFRVVPDGVMMEQSLEEFKKQYDEDVKQQKPQIPIIRPSEEARELRRKDVEKKILNIRKSKVTEPKVTEPKIAKPEIAKPEVMTKKESKTKFTLSNVIKYVKAEQSLATQGPVSLTVYEERKKICGECPHRKTHEKIPDPLGFCTKCGCGANPRARLTNKIKMPQTSCPLDKWGTSTGIYKGVVGKIRHKLTPKSKREKLDYT